MSIIHRPSAVLTDLSFAWPDATPVFCGLTAAFNSGRTGRRHRHIHRHRRLAAAEPHPASVHDGRLFVIEGVGQ